MIPVRQYVNYMNSKGNVEWIMIDKITIWKIWFNVREYDVWKQAIYGNDEVDYYKITKEVANA